MTDTATPFLDVTSQLFSALFTKGLLANERNAIDRQVDDFMRNYRVPAMSIAVTHNGGLVYAKAFGVARRKRGTNRGTILDLISDAVVQKPQPVSIWHRFRIASVSKPITAVAILGLIEQSRLNLTDTVFGPGGILGTDFGFGSLPPEQNTNFLVQITVQHLLEHTCGGWPNDAIDPMLSQPELNQERLITWVLKNRPLDYAPGQVWSYSNFGFCLLGRIIERVSGQTYADFVQDRVLGPCGITTMAIAGDSEAERKSQEVVYYGQPYTVKVKSAGTVLGLIVEDDPYRVPVSRMDSHGGWIATAVDLVRFAVHVDQFNSPPDILNPASITTMITPTTALDDHRRDPHYAKGWKWFKKSSHHTTAAPFDADARLVEHNWFHTGNLPGTLSLLVRSSNGFCWAALVSTRRANDVTQMSDDLEALMWRLFVDPESGKKLVSHWPAQDLFPTYDDPSKAVWSSLKT